MVFPILGGNSVTAGYSIDNSLRFNDDDSPYLTRTPSSAGNRKTYTVSFWVKRGNLGLTYAYIFDCDNGASQSENPISFDSDKIRFSAYNGSSNDFTLETTQVFRDTSAWYHITQVVDTTQATASNRVKFYINGSQITDFGTATYPSLNYDMAINSSSPHSIGRWQDSGTRRFDGYLAEFHFIDGTAKSPTDFGEFDEDSGIWKPIEYTGSYGTNGFYLDFENSGSLGADQSGNSNDFTPTNLASTDQTTDTPTNNFATCNPLNGQDPGNDISEGNLILPADASGDIIAPATQGFSSGKWYMEFKSTISYGTGNRKTVGIYETDSNVQKPRAFTTGYVGCVVDLRVGDVYQDGVDTGNNISTFGDGDICGLFYDADNGNLYIAKNGTLQNSGSPVNSSALDTSKIYTFYFNQDGGGSNAGKLYCNFGNPPTGFSISSGNADANGYGNFEYNPVISSTNYLALCTQNLATELSPTIDDGSQYFETTTYTGNSSTLAITSLNFQPDWLWIKRRSSSSTHALFNSTVGRDKSLGSESSDAEFTSPSDKDLISFDSNGFTVAQPNQRNVNGSGQTFVGWSWKANGGTTSSNTDGSITSTVQANTTAGFSVVTYTGNATAGATIGHGLGVTPSMFIIKGRSLNGSWVTFHQDLGATKALALQGTNAPVTSSAYFNNTAPTSSVITLGYDGAGNEVNNGSDTFVAYCFADIEGYSKFGSGTGTGTSSTNFIYTGFKPSWVMVKRTDSTDSWVIFDNKRPSYNVTPNRLFADLTNAESTSSSNQIDMVSNGFVARGTSMTWNASGSSFIYMAFAENPFVSSTGIPVTAR